MKKIKELQARLKSGKFEEQYPEYDPGDGKVHLLYLAPCLNRTGYYRVIAPALELNETETHCAIISGIHNWDFTRQFDDYDSPVDERLVQWADYVILPPMFTDTKYIRKALDAVNENLQYVMDLDRNVHRLPESHPDHAKITEEMKAMLLKNLSEMDIVTMESPELADDYEVLLDEYHPTSTVYIECLPDLVSEQGYAGLPPVKSPANERVRIGLIGTAATAFDPLSILDALHSIQQKYGDKVEWVLFGWDGQLNGKDQLKGLPVTYVKSVHFLDYFQTLSELALDMALLPLADLPYNTKGGSIKTYMELSVFGIPVVASNLEPYAWEIESGETGILAKDHADWLTAIESLMEDKVLRERIGREALRSVWQDNGFTTKNRKVYHELFV
ncbi:MAG: glycosyltransferase [Bacteroidota bacterium]